MTSTCGLRMALSVRLSVPPRLPSRDMERATTGVNGASGSSSKSAGRPPGSELAATGGGTPGRVSGGASGLSRPRTAC
jgi:hypothetical protein